MYILMYAQCTLRTICNVSYDISMNKLNWIELISCNHFHFQSSAIYTIKSNPVPSECPRVLHRPLYQLYELSLLKMKISANEFLSSVRKVLHAILSSTFVAWPPWVPPLTPRGWFFKVEGGFRLLNTMVILLKLQINVGGQFPLRTN